MIVITATSTVCNAIAATAGFNNFMVNLSALIQLNRVSSDGDFQYTAFHATSDAAVWM